MVLTKRDLGLVKLISQLAIMTTNQIGRTVFLGIATTTVLRRLRILEKGKYLQRIEGLPNYELAWCLTNKGAEAVGYLNPKTHFNRLSLPHEVQLVDLRLILEGQGVARSWIPEHEVRSQMARKHGLSRMRNKSVPDGIMGIEYQDIMESVAVELELHYKNQCRYRDIFWSYREKTNVKAVWYFVQSKSLGEHLAKLWIKHIGKSSGPWFFWSLLEDVLTNGQTAVIHHFEKSFEIRRVFAPKLPEKIATPGAHEGGSGVSRQSEELLVNKINSTHEDQKANQE